MLKQFIKDFYGVDESFDDVPHVVRTIDSPYLPDYETFIGYKKTTHRKILFVKSTMGTGKTVKNLSILKHYPSHLIISPRITLSQSLKRHRSADPNTRLYSSITGPLSHIEHPKLICQFQSLHRIRNIFKTEMYAKWKVLILDEIDAILKEMICSNTMTPYRRKRCQFALKKLINNGADLIIISDAYLAKWHYKFIIKNLLVQDLTDSITLAINTHPGALLQFKEIELYPSFSLGTVYLKEMENALIDEERDKDKKEESKYIFKLCKRLSTSISTQEQFFLKILRETYEKNTAKAERYDDASYAMFRDVIKKRRKIAVICSTKKVANITAEFFINYCQLENEEDVLLVTGDREDRSEYLKKIPNCRVLIYSSCIKVGVDFNDCSFNAVYVLLSKTHPLALSDIIQMIGRVRRFNKLVISIEFEKSHWCNYKKRGGKRNNNNIEYTKPTELIDQITDPTKTVIMIKNEERRLNKLQPNFVYGIIKILTYNISKTIPLIVNKRKYYSIKSAFMRLNPILDVKNSVWFLLSDYGALSKKSEYLKAAVSSILGELQSRTFVSEPECINRFLNFNTTKWGEKLKELYYFSGCVNSLAGIVTLMSKVDDREMEKLCAEEVEQVMSVNETGLISGDWNGDKIPTSYVRITGVYRYLEQCIKRIKGNSCSITTDETKRISSLAQKIINKEFNDTESMKKLHAFFIDEVLSDNIEDVIQNVRDHLIFDIEAPPTIDINKFLLYYAIV